MLYVYLPIFLKILFGILMMVLVSGSKHVAVV